MRPICNKNATATATLSCSGGAIHVIIQMDEETLWDDRAENR